MPGITIERPKMTRVMYQSLKKHIMRSRERKKQEQEHDKAMEQQRKEQEQRKKKEQEDSLTLEQTRDQVSSLERRLESLKAEKHELFSQLKKVLHQEDENRKRAQIKEHNEMVSLQQQYAVAHPIFMAPHMHQRGQQKFMNVPLHQPITTQHGVKRTRSPSPTPSGSIYHYPGAKYPVTTSFSMAQMKRGEEAFPAVAKSSSYPSTHVTFASQSGLPHPYAQHMQTQPPAAPQHPPKPTPHQATHPQHQPQAQQHQPPQHKTHQAPPQHQAHQQAPPTHQQAPPPQHQAPPTQLKAPPSQHQAPTHQQGQAAQHQAPPTHQQAPPPQHVPASQHQSGSHHPQAPPHQTSQQHQPPPSQLQGSQSQGSKYPAAGSAFQSYSHFGHQQKGMGDRMPQGYPGIPQRVPQPGFIGTPHGSPSLTLQQQLEHANQKSGFSEEKFKMQQSIRGVAPIPPQQAQMMTSAPLPSSQPSPQQPPKGSIVTGYPVRTQTSSNYPTATTQSSHSQHGTAPRHNYGRQGQGPYY